MGIHQLYTHNRHSRNSLEIVCLSCRAGWRVISRKPRTRRIGGMSTRLYGTWRTGHIRKDAICCLSIPGTCMTALAWATQLFPMAKSQMRYSNTWTMTCYPSGDPSFSPSLIKETTSYTSVPSQRLSIKTLFLDIKVNNQVEPFNFRSLSNFECQHYHEWNVCSHRFQVSQVPNTGE